MVASKIQIPVFVVLDSGKVADKTTVTEPGVKTIEVVNLRALVQQHLPKALGRFFAMVEVVTSPDALPSTPHLVVDVEVQKLGMIFDKATSGSYTAGRIYGTLTWGVGIRHHDSKSYGFSYSATVTGNKPLTHVSETSTMYASTPSVAVGQLNKRLAEGGIHALVRRSQAPRTFRTL